MSYRLAPPEPTYSSQELANQLGVPLRRIRYWRGHGLIDPPTPPHGRSARYCDRHIAQGRALLRLRDETPVLAHIGQILSEDAISITDYIAQFQDARHA